MCTETLCVFINGLLSPEALIGKSYILNHFGFDTLTTQCLMQTILKDRYVIGI